MAAAAAAAKSVWIVDDSRAVAESFAALLASEAIPARTFYDGTSVLEALGAGEEPSAMLLDISMPPDNGNSVLDWVAKNPAWTFPVLVLTGAVESLRKDLAGRAFVVMEKPIDPLVLVAHLRRALNPTNPAPRQESTTMKKFRFTNGPLAAVATVDTAAQAAAKFNTDFYPGEKEVTIHDSNNMRVVLTVPRVEAAKAENWTEEAAPPTT